MLLMKTRVLIFILLAAVCSGCAKVAQLQELLTLKGYSDEKVAEEKYIKAQDRKFEKLMAAVQGGTIKKYAKAAAVLKTFGDPVFIRPAVKDGAKCEEWLYRYTIKYFDSPKVYLYFDSKGKILSWEFLAAPCKEDSHDSCHTTGQTQEGNPG